MPVAVLVAGLVAIALAFAAITATLVVENLLIGPLLNAASSVSEVAVVGGILAWMLTQLVSFIRYSLAGVQTLVSTAETQAADWWNYLVVQTIQSAFSYWWDNLAWLVQQEGGIAWLEAYMPSLWSFTLSSVWPTVVATHGTVNQLVATIYGYVMPRLAGIGDDLLGLHHWLDGYLVPRINGIGNDLAGLRDWVGRNAATHAEVSNAEAQAIARAAAMAVPIAAAVTAIENSPCMKFCGPLGELGQGLQLLEDAAIEVALLELLQIALQHPDQIHGIIETTVVPAARDAVSALGLGIPD